MNFLKFFSKALQPRDTSSNNQMPLERVHVGHDLGAVSRVFFTKLLLTVAYQALCFL